MLTYDYVTSFEVLGQIAREVESLPWHALDLETTALNPRDGQIRLCSINTGARCYVIDLFKTGTLGPVAEALARTPGLTIGQNLKFDQKWLLYKCDIELKRVFDTFRASNLIHNGHKFIEHDLYALYRRELNIGPEAPDLGGSGWTQNELTREQLDYAAEDVTHLPALYTSLRAKLIKEGLVRIAAIEFGAILPEAAIELNGFGFDKEKWRTLAQMNAARARALQALLTHELPNPSDQLVLPGIVPGKKLRFNLDSPAQALESFRRLGVTQRIRNPETNQMQTVPLQDTNEMTLAMLAAQHPIIEKFIEYRGYAQRVKSFGENYFAHVSPKTGRIHTDFWPFTGAGRYACVVAETPVLTLTGAKPIIEVRAGDRVWTHRNRWRVVKAFIPQGIRPTYSVKLSTGGTLTCTGTHRLLLSDRRWLSVQEMLTNGRKMPCFELYAGQARPVVIVEDIDFIGNTEVYDLTVEEDESYETYGVFSHNSSKPNLQQIPRDKDYRACFVAGEGCELAIGDYSNIEMRLVAEVSGDERLIKIFADGKDAHRETAALLTLTAPEQVTKDQRQQAKPVNFGFCYGMFPARLVLYARSSYGVTLSEKQASVFRTRYFEAYKGVAAWHERAFAAGERQKAAWTIWRRRRILDSDSEHNAFLNSPIQGCGADGLKNSLPLIYQRCKKLSGGSVLLEKGARLGMVHMVHDENVIEHRNEGPEFSKYVQAQLAEAMIEGMAPMMQKVSTTVETGGGPSWASKS